MAVFQAKLKLLAGLLLGDKAYSAPWIIKLDLLNHCNFKCLNCHYHSPAHGDSPRQPKEMDFDLIRRLALELNPDHTHSITLTASGEPLLYPRIIEAVELFKQKGFRVHLFTNGFLLDAKLGGELLRAGLDDLGISLWASSPEQYALNYPGSPLDNYFRVLENMTRICEMKRERQLSKPLISWQYPLNRHNSATLDALLCAAGKMRCDRVIFSPLMENGGKHADSALEDAALAALKGELNKLRPQFESAGMMHNIPETLLRYQLGHAAWQQFSCYMPWIQARIGVDGGLQSCARCNVSFGNLKEKSLAQLWNGPKIREFRRLARTRSGQSKLAAQCDCNNCCFTLLNRNVHRHYRWFDCSTMLRGLFAPGPRS